MGVYDVKQTSAMCERRQSCESKSGSASQLLDGTADRILSFPETLEMLELNKTRFLLSRAENMFSKSQKLRLPRKKNEIMCYNVLDFLVIFWENW